MKKVFLLAVLCTLVGFGGIYAAGVSNVTNDTNYQSGTTTTFESGSTVAVASGATWTVADGAIPRADLTEDALAVYSIFPHEWRDSSSYASLATTETAGTFNVGDVGDAFGLIGEVTNNETETSTAIVLFTLPPEYVAAGDVSVSIRDVTSDAVSASTIDVELFEVDTAGDIDSDICATAAQAITSTAGTDTFTITATDLVAGDTLLIRLTTAIVDPAGGTTATALIPWVKVLCDIKG
jgi:hypothetical protein